MKRKIGILGGSFDPVHNGHVVIAQDAMRGRALAEVLFVPCNKPSHKDDVLAPSVHRLAMLKIALRDNPDFTVSDADIRRGGITYSVDTVRELARGQPGVEVFFIIGSDSLADLHRWRAIEELFRLCRFIVMARPGFEPAAMLRQSGLAEDRRDALLQNVVKGRLSGVSSSDIRARIAGGAGFKDLVPQGVEAYIAENHLYGAA